MNDFLTNLVARALNVVEVVRPWSPSLFEPIESSSEILPAQHLHAGDDAAALNAWHRTDTGQNSNTIQHETKPPKIVFLEEGSEMPAQRTRGIIKASDPSSQSNDKQSPPSGRKQPEKEGQSEEFRKPWGLHPGFRQVKGAPEPLAGLPDAPPSSKGAPQKNLLVPTGIAPVAEGHPANPHTAQRSSASTLSSFETSAKHDQAEQTGKAIKQQSSVMVRNQREGATLYQAGQVSTEAQRPPNPIRVRPHRASPIEQQAGQPRGHQVRAEVLKPEPTIQVTIGRIEVRAVTQAVQNHPKAKGPAPPMTLSEYLQRRTGGQH